MADISDVTAFLVGLITPAIYPNGTGAPSIVNGPVLIAEGWPRSDQIDLDMQGLAISPTTGLPVPTGLGPRCNITIFPLPGSAPTYQIEEKPYTIVPPVHGITPAVSGNVLTLTGAPGTGEVVSLVVDRARHIYSRTGASLAAIIAALLADIQVDYPSASAGASTITIPTAADIIARVGAPATLGKVVHRQTESIAITVWAPDPQRRSQLSAVIDVLLKNTLKVTFPDTSIGLIVYERTHTEDEYKTVAIYRRDLQYGATYATVQQFQAMEITVVATTAAPDQMANEPDQPTGMPTQVANS